jgi:hypothetical protein
MSAKQSLNRSIKEIKAPELGAHVIVLCDPLIVHRFAS